MNNNGYRITFPLTSVLGVVFIVLKLTGVIAWSWWWVLAPFWLPFALFLVVGGFVFLLIMIRESLSPPRHGKGVGKHRR